MIPNIASWFELEASISPHFTDGSEEAYKLPVSLPNQGHSGNKCENPEQSPDFYLHFQISVAFHIRSEHGSSGSGSPLFSSLLCLV